MKRILKATSRGNCPAAPVQLLLDPGISHTQLEPHLGLMNKVSKKSILHPTIKLIREKALGKKPSRLEKERLDLQVLISDTANTIVSERCSTRG